MKKRLLILMTVTGMIILLGGLLTYGLGVHEIIPVPRPDLIVVGTFRYRFFLKNHHINKQNEKRMQQ